MIDKVLCFHNGVPQWRNAGNWGLLTWDHQLPGPIIGTKIYTIKTKDVHVYPSVAGSVAEIQVRDFSDKANHTFTTYAKLDQIISAEGVKICHMWLIVNDGSLYVTGVNKWRYDPSLYYRDFQPDRIFLYRLDGVDSSNAGVFTLVNSVTVPSTSFNPPWVPATGYGAINLDSGAEPMTHYQQVAFNSGIPHVYNGWGGNVATWNSDQHFESVLAWLPYDSLGKRWDLVSRETGTPRAVGWIGSFVYTILQEYTRYCDFNISNSPVITGTSTTPIGYAYRTYNGTGIRALYPGTSSEVFNGRLAYAHPATFLRSGVHSDLLGGSGVLVDAATRSAYSSYNAFHIKHDKTFSIMGTPGYTPPSGHYICGVWGDSQAHIYFGSRNGTWIGMRDMAYTDFYVIRPSDTTASTRYSIYSELLEDGAVMHIEGLEDPTPTLWIDNTFVGNLN